jgi:DNA-binding CsgD family transcriptional regulator
MDNEPRAGDLIGLIYDAAVSPERWALFLDRLCDLAPGAKGSMMLHDAKTQSAVLPSTARWEDDWLRSYTDYYVKLNQWTARPNLEVGKALHCDDLVPRKTVQRSEFYADWLRPQNLISGIAILTFSDVSRYMAITILHKDIAEEVHRRNVAVLQTLSPHLLRAAQIHRQISGLHAKAESFESAFDHLDRGVVLLDGGGRAFYFNRQARSYLARGQGLAIGQGGQLRCARWDAHDKLLKAIFKAAQTAAGAGDSAGEIIAVPRPLGMTPWAVMVAPLPASALDLGRPEGAVALFIVDPDQRPTLSVAALRSVLGLTASEARIVVALADGNTPEEIGAKHGITILTVRTHLRNAMRKTGTDRLSELAALALRCGRAPLV